MTATFPDHFSALAGRYAAARPGYPAALFAWLARQCSAHELAWDCGAGSGQASLALAAHFARVVASDASAEQIASAPAAPGVEYRVAAAEASGLSAHCADLVVVAQALHWFRTAEFYREATRVLKPGGVLAVWCYGVLTVEDGDLNALLYDFYAHRVGPCWPAEREHVENGYRDLAFPYAPLAVPEFAMQADWTLPQLLAYFRSWSAVGRYQSLHGVDPVEQFAPQLAAVWGDVLTTRTVRWPLTVLCGHAP